MNTITKGDTGEIIGGEKTKREYSDEYKRLWVKFACAFADIKECPSTAAHCASVMVTQYEERFGEV